MARKELTLTVEAEGRDKGKMFVLREMSAAQAESWAIRAFLAMARSGVDVPEDVASAGLAGVAAMGMKAFGGLRYQDAEPLLAEMMACVQIIPDPSRSTKVQRPLVEDDIEEVRTRFFLRTQIFELHTGFSVAAGLSPSTPPTAQSPASSSTQTSLGPSAP